MRCRPWLALAALIVAASCVGPKPYAWTDRSRRFRVESDYPELAYLMTMAFELHEKLAVLDDIFGQADLSSLQVVIHDEPAGGAAGRRQGEHWRGRIDLWAGDMDSLDGSSEPPPLPRLDQVSMVHEFVHAYVYLKSHDVPRWLEDGLANVIAYGVIDAGGRWHLFRSPAIESAARDALADGSAFTPDELFTFVSHYPAPDRWPVFYSQSTSLVRFLLERESGDVARRVRAVLQIEGRVLRDAYAEWLQELSSSPVITWYEDHARHPAVAFRKQIASGLGALARDAAWLGLSAVLLDDPEAQVRQSARIRCVVAPWGGSDGFVERARWFSRSEKPRVRLAGLVGLAQAGDLDVAHDVLVSLSESPDIDEWWQCVLWIAMRFPGRPGALKLPPISAKASGQLAPWCASFAAWIRESRDDLTWNPKRGVYVHTAR